MESKEIERVRDYWEDTLCGSHFVDEERNTKAFFENYTRFRYRKEHHLLSIIDWASARGKDVLEVGLGVGADGVRWAQHANSYTGIDLTNEAVNTTRQHFAHLGLSGNIIQGNAENMPFDDNAFDIVYSHGVLHHTENIDNTFSEIRRVLKPGGQFIIMLYTKDSFNYWIRIQLYFRIRFIFELLKSKLGLSNSKTWREHIDNFKRMGWSYLSWKEFPHHCTDGPNCTIANIYYPVEVIQQLAKHHLKVSHSCKTHFPIFKGKRLVKLEAALARRLGFFRFYFGKNEK